MSGKMKRLRRTNNPMDRNTRNDFNYNWDVLDGVLSDIETSEVDNTAKFTEVHDKLNELESVDKKLSERIQQNKDTIDAMNPELIKEQGRLAEEKGNIAKEQGEKSEEQGLEAEEKGDVAQSKGNKAETQGNKAEQQGDYAEEQGKFANEKAEYAAETTSKIIEVNEDLAKIKLETIEATQKANKSADHAQQAGDKATEQVERVQPIIDKSETVLEEVEQATDNANTSADYAKEQGDYAKDTVDKVIEAHTDLSKVKEETINATNEANVATTKATEATNKANTSAEKADEQATRAEEKTDYLETLLPNIEGWEFKGEWQKDEQYEKHNIVTFNGSTFILFPDTAEGSPADDNGWHMLARRGVDGEGAVQTVNKLAPDLEGNVDLGELATPDDIQQANEDTLNKAKAYTDEAIGNIDLSEIEQQLNEHSSKIATEDELGHIRVGKNMKIDDSGVLSTKVASENTADWDTDDGFINSQLAKKNLVIHKENTLQGILKAHENNSFSVGQVRNVIIANESPTETFGKVGDIWMEVSDDVLPMKLSDVPVNAMVDIGLEVEGHKAWFTKLADNHYGQGEATLYSKDVLWQKAFDAKEPLNENENRQKYGNNNVRYSNLLQWLNSDEDDWFIKQHDTDQAPTSEYVSANPYADESGFLTLLPKEVKENLVEVTRIAIEPDIDGGGTKEYKAKVFPLSRTEIGLGDEREADGKPFPQFDSNESRIATLIGATSKSYYCLSTPYASDVINVRIVNSGAALHFSSADNGKSGVRPALTFLPNTPIYKISDNEYTLISPKIDGVKKVSNIFINTGGDL